MWSPTHICVTVQRAKGLLTKGKNNTNNCFVTIGLGKEKYQTSIKDKAEANVSWNEECELKIPDQGNRAELVLTCLHRNNLAIDEFLGQVTLPLNEMDVYDRPRSKWFKLESKPGKEKKNKERGELEIRVNFTVKSGSLTDLSKKEKHKSSIGKLAGSVMSLSEKRKGMKNFAKSIGSKMNLTKSKNKHKDGDDGSSFSGSFASIGTPNGSTFGSRRYDEQYTRNADPGVIEDEDDFKFQNLSPKSSTGSLNTAPNKLRLPSQNFEPRNPSPLLRNGRNLGKQYEATYSMNEEEYAIEEEEKHNEHTSPPLSPTKPPRSTQFSVDKEKELNAKVDEWETKLYGKHLDINNSDSLKRHSWDLNPVRLPVANEPDQRASPNFESNKKETQNEKVENLNQLSSSSLSSSSSSEDEAPIEPKSSPKPQANNNLLSPESEHTSNDFDKLNATFAKFEQRNSSSIFDTEADEKKWFSQSFIEQEAKQQSPQPKPRQRETEKILSPAIDADIEESQKRRAEEDARLEAELRLNEQRLQEEELALQQELKQQEEAKNRRELKRREEDERILNFAKKRSTSVEEASSPLPQANYASTTPEQSPKQRVGEHREKRFGKFKYFNKRDKNEAGESSSSSPKSNERIIIGHEKATSHSDRRSEITAALSKKYEGKSREELMLIANGMENEALIQRQRVKELEDYLDNLLLRVMETHPKILQNPYSRTTSAKSG